MGKTFRIKEQEAKPVEQQPLGDKLEAVKAEWIRRRRERREGGK